MCTHAVATVSNHRHLSVCSKTAVRTARMCGRQRSQGSVDVSRCRAHHSFDARPSLCSPRAILARWSPCPKASLTDLRNRVEFGHRILTVTGRVPWPVGWRRLCHRAGQTSNSLRCTVGARRRVQLEYAGSLVRVVHGCLYSNSEQAPSSELPHGKSYIASLCDVHLTCPPTLCAY